MKNETFIDDGSFLSAIAVVLEHEGQFVNDPVDPGGATNFGVSLRFLKSVGDFDGDFNEDGQVDVLDIKAMSRADAVQIYYVHWWQKYKYGELSASVAKKVFDLSVNMGATQAHKILQRACRASGANLVEDGIIGSKTRGVIKSLDKWGLVTALRAEAAGFYRRLIVQKPHFEKYRAGWLRRAYS